VVGLAVPFAGPVVAVEITPVPVGRVAVKSPGVVTPCVAVVVWVSVAGTTDVADASGRVAVSVTDGAASVGRAVKVCATAVLNKASDVAAESTVGPVGGVGVNNP
jgi:hypothetical protein